MAHLRKTRIFSYILPLIVAGLLFSTVVSVFSLDPPEGYTLNGYIGKIESDFNTTYNTELTSLYIYTDRGLTSPPTGAKVQIYRGPYDGDPAGLIATALSALIQRTKVQVVSASLGGGDYKVLFIQPYDNPDDIASLFGGFTFDDIYSTFSDLSVDLDGQLSSVNNIQLQSTDLLGKVGSLTTNMNSQTASLININTKVGAISNKVNDIGMAVGNHTAAFTGISATIGSIDSKNADVISKASGINMNVGGTNTYLTNEITNIINPKLASEGALLTNIWNKLNTTNSTL